MTKLNPTCVAELQAVVLKPVGEDQLHEARIDDEPY